MVCLLKSSVMLQSCKLWSEADVKGSICDLLTQSNGETNSNRDGLKPRDVSISFKISSSTIDRHVLN
jgi:hypothetical protein